MMTVKNEDIKIDVDEFLALRGNVPVIDVRTPAEFEKAHVPGAINIPLFSNEQRVVIGTIYKQKSKEQAVMKGLDFVGPEMSRILRDAKRCAKNGDIIVHCWRGGMRSESVAWLLGFAGLNVKVLRGGYKNYRRAMQKMFIAPQPYVVLGGMTGSGKTDILKKLHEKGEQFIDLEGLANHKGSVFGGIGQEDQPSTEMFENLLAEEIMKLQQDRICWIEDESANIGQVRLPKPFWDIKRSSPIVEVVVDRKVRIDRLVHEYGSQQKEELKNAVHRITKRLGSDRATQCINAIDEGNMALVADYTLHYYDKGYKNAMKREEDNRKHFECSVSDEYSLEIITDDLLKLELSAGKQNS